MPDTAHPVGLKGFGSCLRAAGARGNPCCLRGYIQSWGNAASLGVAAMSVGLSMKALKKNGKKMLFLPSQTLQFVSSSPLKVGKEVEAGCTLARGPAGGLLEGRIETGSDLLGLG